MKFKIRGQYKDRPSEIIDEFETKEEAGKMMEEYRIAYGDGWRIWLEDFSRPERPLDSRGTKTGRFYR